MMNWILLGCLMVGCGKKVPLANAVGTPEYGIAEANAGRAQDRIGGPEEKVPAIIPGDSKMKFQEDSYTFSVSKPPPASIKLVNAGPGTLTFHHAGGSNGSARFIWPITLEGPGGKMYTFEYPGRKMSTMAIIPPKDYVFQPGDTVDYHLGGRFFKMLEPHMKRPADDDIEEFKFEPGEYWLHVDFQGSKHKTKLVVTP